MNTNPRFKNSSIAQFTFGVVVVLCLAAVAGSAQETLRSTLQNAGTDWVVGTWSGTNTAGQAVTVEYEWELDGRMLEIDLTLGDFSYKGLIFHDPAGGGIVEQGADSAGGVTRSTWKTKDGALISERVGTRPNGETVRVAVMNKRVDAEHVTATVHALSESGEIGADALDTVQLTRRPADQKED